MYANAIKAIGKQLRALTVRHLRKLRLLLYRKLNDQTIRKILALTGQIFAPVLHLLTVHTIRVKICILYACRRQLLTNRLYHYWRKISGPEYAHGFSAFRHNLQLIQFG